MKNRYLYSLNLLILKFDELLWLQDNAALTMRVFSLWIGFCGIILFFTPNIFLDFSNITMEPDILARLFGMVLLFLAFYYYMASKKPEFKEFYRWTTYTRFLALPITIVLVLLKIAETIVITFVLVDFIGALWTTWALRH